MAIESGRISALIGALAMGAAACGPNLSGGMTSLAATASGSTAGMGSALTGASGTSTTSGSTRTTISRTSAAATSAGTSGATTAGTGGGATGTTGAVATTGGTSAATTAAATTTSGTSSGLSACDSCLESNYGAGGACTAVYGTCEADPNCVSVQSCFVACEATDTACQNGCFAAAVGQGAAEFQTLSSCLCGTCTAACTSECSGLGSGAVDCCGGACGASGATCSAATCQCTGGATATGTSTTTTGSSGTTGSAGGAAFSVTVSAGGTPVAGAWVNIDSAHQGTADGTGTVTWSTTPAGPFTVAVTAPYCQAVYQQVASASGTLPISMTCEAATQNTDQIDMSQVTVYDSPPDTPGWPITTYITELDLAGVGGAMYVNFTKRDGNLTWPNVPFGGSGSLEYSLWSVEFIGGQWVASGPMQYWQGDEYSGGDPDGFAANWYYDSRWGPLQGYQPAVGELVGFFVSAGNARNVTDDSGTTVLERSNVLLVPFPAETGAVYFVDGPCGGLASGESLGMGQALTSCDGRFTLTMQNGGDLTLTWAQGQLWDSGTDGHPTANVYMQTDGDFVSYYDCGSNGGSIWDSQTSGNPGATLVLDNGGNLSVQLNGTILWQTNTGGH